MLGLSVGVGGFGALGFGGAADKIGLNFAFVIIIASALVGGILALLLPRARNLARNTASIHRSIGRSLVTDVVSVVCQNTVIASF